MKKMSIRICLLSTALVLAATLVTTRAKLADDFAGDVARGNMAEIALSRLALDRSQNDSVKQFAQKMIDDHTAAGAELQTIATSKNITLPTAMDAKHQSVADKLGTRSGSDFDREYMKTMVNDHEKMAGLLQKQADRGSDADLKAFAAKTLPTVQSHLQMARSLSASLGDGGRSSANSTNTGGMNMNSNRSSNSNSRSNSNKRTNSNSNSNRP